MLENQANTEKIKSAVVKTVCVLIVSASFIFILPFWFFGLGVFADGGGLNKLLLIIFNVAVFGIPALMSYLMWNSLKANRRFLGLIYSLSIAPLVIGLMVLIEYVK